MRLPSDIAAFDCVEFGAELRNIDVISDVSFPMTKLRNDAAIDNHETSELEDRQRCQPASSGNT